MDLSQEQHDAVFAQSKTALCLAGAGSGKTRVLVSRIGHLLEDCQVSPFEVVAFTFTRKAGSEMIERLEKEIGPQVHKVTIGTMHSVALKMIQRFGEFIGLKPGKITVYSSWEEGILLKDVCQELGYHNGKTWKGVKKKEIDAAFYLFYTMKKRNERDYIPTEIMDSFFLRCKENNALTYGMIMTSFMDIIPRIGRMIKYKHVLVDEVQDLDPLQWRITKLICAVCDASLFAVGDDSQSIYGFRGADPDYLIRNQEKFDIYKLKDNYRSDGKIVECANKLIRNNVNRLDLEMNPIRPEENEISVIPGMDSEKLMENLLQKPADFEGKVGVLGRNHFLLEKLSRLLEENEIDHDYIGKKTAFTRSEEFRRVHAFLTLAVNNFDNFSFLLVKEYLGIYIPEYKAIRMKAVKENKSHFQTWEALCEEGEQLEQFLIDYLYHVSDNSFPGILKWLEGINFGFNQLDVLDFIQEYLDSKHNPTIEEYLSWLALYDVQDEMTEESKKLQLMTIHASKGLEFDMVIIAGMNEGILPSSRAMSSPSELEAERRLAYVAYTRARDHLIMTSRPVNLEAKFLQHPSRFIKESV